MLYLDFKQSESQTPPLYKLGKPSATKGGSFTSMMGKWPVIWRWVLHEHDGTVASDMEVGLSLA